MLSFPRFQVSGSTVSRFLKRRTAAAGSSSPAAYTSSLSIRFDGINEHATSSAPLAAINGASNLTIAGWFRPDETIPPGSSITLFGQIGGTAGTAPIYAFISSGYFVVDFRLGTAGNRYALSALPLASGTWSHIVIAYSSSAPSDLEKISLYINDVYFTGSLVGASNPAALPSGSVSFSVGARQVSTGSMTLFAEVSVDELAIWDRVLSRSQATSLYAVYSSGNEDLTGSFSPAPVHWWKMGEGASINRIPDVGVSGSADLFTTNMEAGDIIAQTP